MGMAKKLAMALAGASVVLMMLPQLGRIPSWETAVLILALGWKLFSVWRGLRMPRLLLPVLALVAGPAAVPVDSAPVVAVRGLLLEKTGPHFNINIMSYWNG